MRKLLVFVVATNAVSFLFREYRTIFRVSWLPFLLLVAVGFAQMVWFLLTPPDAATAFDPKLNLAFQLVGGLLQLIAGAAVAVAIHRIILFDDRQPGNSFAFAFGPTEFLYAIMVIAMTLMVLALVAAIMVPVIYAAAATNPAMAEFLSNLFEFYRRFFVEGRISAPPIPFGVTGFGWLVAGYIAAIIAAVWLLTRLAIWPPSVVATNSLAIGPVLEATRGNVWAFIGLFFLVAIVVAVFVGIFMAAAMSVIMPFVMSSLPQAPPMTPADIEKMKDVAELQRFALQRMGNMKYVFIVMSFVQYFLNIFVGALFVALLSYAYKNLNGYEADKPIRA